MIKDKPNSLNKSDDLEGYICPTEGCNLIPEIISVHSELGLIVLKCSKGHENEINVENYFNILKEKEKIKPIGDNIDNQKEINESDAINSRDILEKKIDLISDIIQAHKQIIKTQNQYPENYFHNQNIINLEEFIKKEEEAKASKDNKNNNKNNNQTIKIGDVIKEIETKREKEGEKIEELSEKYGIKLDKEKHINKELNLILKGPNTEDRFKKLRDKGFKLLSQVTFKNLIGLNLANNEIIDISPLNDMLLPHLETIDLSDNQIVDIIPVANLCSENLNEIYLQKNKIKDLGPFLNSDFKNLEILRVDGNEKAIKKNSFKAVREKFKKIGCNIISEPKKWNDFAKKYNLDIDPEKFDINDKKYEKLDLGSRRNGEILKDLYPLIISPNRIKYLILDDNKLEDVSLLKKIPLYNLIQLDLSLNYITSIRFLKKMSKCQNLQQLYLHDNKINDISPIKGNPFLSKLEILTLKNNCLDLNDPITRDILTEELKKLSLDYTKEDLGLKEDEKKENTRKTKIE